MAEVVYLSPNEQMPEVGDDQPWLTIDATSDARFIGTGASWKANGEWVGFCSLPEDDVTLETALLAAREWAEKYRVPTIWVQLAP